MDDRPLDNKLQYTAESDKSVQPLRPKQIYAWMRDTPWPHLICLTSSPTPKLRSPQLSSDSSVHTPALLAV